MKPERWQQLDQLLEAALERSPAERTAFLAEACEDDETLRQEVESLLRSDEAAESFIETPVVALVAEALADKQARSLIEKQLGHYQILSQLGAGGMGEVYLAEDTKLHRRVALKLLPAKLTADKDAGRRFLHEARAAAALDHPNICAIHEIGEANSVSFIVLEYVKGQTLAARINGQPLKVDEIVEIGSQIADALDEAHGKGITHRDIKPANVMLNARGQVKVLDFGLAKITRPPEQAAANELSALAKTAPGVVLGTVPYMSPEQALGREVDSRSDLFSLGAMLYEMATGRLPFAGANASETLSLILHAQPEALARFNPDAPAELERIVRKCLEKERERRYQSARELLVDLQNLKRDSESKAVSAEPVAARPQRPRSRLSLSLIAPLVLPFAAIALGYWFYANRSANTKQIASVAVLPFVNESGDANFDYLSDGLSESLIDRLVQLPQIKVIARNSSFKYRGQNLDLNEVATTLGVQAIVTGRVVQRGDHLSVRIEMIDVRDNRQLWSDIYNRRATDVQAVQGEIAQTASEKLRLRLTGVQTQQLTKTATANAEAYQLYLNGKFVSRPSLKKSLDYFIQATKLDPNFALAYYKVSWCYFNLGRESDLDPKGTIPKARAALQRALELDDTLAEAHSLMAEIKRSDWDWAGADTELARVIELAPNTAIAHQSKANRLATAGHFEEALIESRHAQELDPLEGSWKIQEVVFLLLARRFDEAIAKAQQFTKLAPNHPGSYIWLGYTYAAKGLYPEAVAEYQKGIKIYPDNTGDKCFLGYALAKSGKSKEALAILNKLKTEKEYVSPTELAILYVGLGDKKAAFQSLEKAYAERDMLLQDLKKEPHFDDLRDDPRFQDLLRRVGLMP